MSGPSPENLQVESGTVLRRALRDAVEDDLLKPNPADGVKLPKVARAKITTWTPTETRYALAELEKPLTAMVHVTATTGMRRSEVLGLRWDSVDLNSAHLEVTGTLVMVAGQPHFSELTKTRASRRRIALDRRTVELIRSHRCDRCSCAPTPVNYRRRVSIWYSPTRSGSPSHRIGSPAPFRQRSGASNCLPLVSLACGTRLPRLPWPMGLTQDRLGEAGPCLDRNHPRSLLTYVRGAGS